MKRNLYGYRISDGPDDGEVVKNQFFPLGIIGGAKYGRPEELGFIFEI